ncbi:ABC transporter permease [Bdellovibrionota bacterium FG-1]
MKNLSIHLARLWLGLWLMTALLIGLGTGLGYFPHLIEHNLPRTLGGPTFQHPFGFDAFGRDLLLITLQASSISAFFAAFATLTASGLGVLLGTWIAISPHRLNFFLSRCLETVLAFPSLLFALAWAAIRGPGWDTLAMSLLLGSVPGLTRLIQVRAREILSEDYVLAARSLGASGLRVGYRHIAPAVISFCRIKAPNLFASALMAEATLSFLGLGAPIGRDTWGSLLAQGKDYLIEAPHLAFGAGLPLVLTVLSVQILASRQSRN